MSPSLEEPILEKTSMLPASDCHASSPELSSAATNPYRATSKGVAAVQQKVGDFKSTAFVDVNPQPYVLTIHNGESDSGECELKAPQSS